MYNGEGDLAKKIEVDASGSEICVTSYEYDSLDRLIRSGEERNTGEGLKEVQRSQHIYDEENRISSQSWTVGGDELERKETYTYNTADGSLQTMVTATGETIVFGYDSLKRLSSISGGVTGRNYSYRSYRETNEAGVSLLHATSQISQIQYTGVANSLSYSYEYDETGNISKITQNGSVVAEYDYDAQNQLVSENLPTQNVRYEYVYDTVGNILEVETYANGSSTPTIVAYTYGNSDWVDLLTAYNGQAITYDAIGNPLTYNNGTAWTFEWQGAHDLTTATTNGKSISYHYDMDGIRDSKTVNGVTHEYITQGGNVALEQWTDTTGSHSLEFIYDNGGAPYSVIYDGVTYYYILNQQGDVVRIVDSTGATKAEYTYDAWGKILNVSNATGSDIGTVNPLRYRGYYYDTELGMYYVQSRYYDPVVKRMICADDESIVAGASLNNNNLFAYCDNNPVNRADDNGDFWNVAIRAAIGVGLELAYQVVVEQKRSISDIDWVSVAASGASSAFGATGFGVGAQIAVNAAIGAATQAINDRNEQLSTKDRVLRIAGSAIASGVATKLGGKGTNDGKVYTKATKGANLSIKRELRRANTKVAKKRIIANKAYKCSIYKTFTKAHTKSASKSFLAGKGFYKLGSGVYNAGTRLWRKFLKWRKS